MDLVASPFLFKKEIIVGHLGVLVVVLSFIKTYCVVEKYCGGSDSVVRRMIRRETS